MGRDRQRPRRRSQHARHSNRLGPAGALFYGRWRHHLRQLDRRAAMDRPLWAIMIAALYWRLRRYRSSHVISFIPQERGASPQRQARRGRRNSGVNRPRTGLHVFGVCAYAAPDEGAERSSWLIECASSRSAHRALRPTRAEARRLTSVKVGPSVIPRHVRFAFDSDQIGVTGSTTTSASLPSKITGVG